MSVFICLPTLGRASIFTALLSIEAQTDKSNIHILVINDSDTELQLESSVPLTLLKGAKCGKAGLTRNIGLQYARNNNAEWILMLDDDDTLHPRTIELLRTYSNVQCVLFRAAGITDHLPFMTPIPSANTNDIICGQAAISFALHKTTNEEFGAEQGGEDYFLLKKIHKIMISKYLVYGIRVSLPFKLLEVGNDLLLHQC
jgi:glycosyltransferase involved in cell wall biosynthesis